MRHVFSLLGLFDSLFLSGLLFLFFLACFTPILIFFRGFAQAPQLFRTSGSSATSMPPFRQSFVSSCIPSRFGLAGPRAHPPSLSGVASFLLRPCPLLLRLCRPGVVAWTHGCARACQLCRRSCGHSLPCVACVSDGTRRSRTAEDARECESRRHAAPRVIARRKRLENGSDGEVPRSARVRDA